MRKRMAIIALGLMTLGLGASAAPAGAIAKDGPVEVRKECGSYNVYVFGSPLIHYVWCPSDS